MTKAHIRDGLAGIAGPFLLHVPMVVVAIQLEWRGAWLTAGLVPCLVGFVFVERAIGLRAAFVAVVYFPVMLMAMVFVTLAVGAMLSGAPL